MGALLFTLALVAGVGFFIGGPAVAAVMGAAYLAFVVWRVHAAVDKSLIGRPAMGSLPAARVPPQVHQLAGRVQELGFVPLGEPIAIAALHPAVVVPLVHPSEPIMALVTHIDAPKPRCWADFGSRIDLPEQAGLSTTSSREAGTLPRDPAQPLQIIETPYVEDLLSAHKRGLDELAERGIRIRRMTRDELQNLLAESFVRVRARFEGARLKTTLVALWRTLMKTNPHVGLLGGQKKAPSQLDWLEAKIKETRSP